jgi:hypothetical protein
MLCPLVLSENLHKASLHYTNSDLEALASINSLWISFSKNTDVHPIESQCLIQDTYFVVTDWVPAMKPQLDPAWQISIQFKYQALFFPWWYANQVQHDKDQPGKEQTEWVRRWKMSGLRGLERAPSRAGVERRTSGPHRQILRIKGYWTLTKCTRLHRH